MNSISNSILSQYHSFFDVKCIEYINSDDPDVDDLISQGVQQIFIKFNSIYFLIKFFYNLQKPFIIENSDLASHAVRNWSLDYLKQELNDSNLNVFESNNNLFKFWDETKVRNIQNFQKPTNRKEMRFDNFINALYNRDSKL